MRTRNTQKRALIIEDNEILINFYKSSLSKYNCIVDLAFTLEMAREKVAERKYDLYIIDKTLPDGDATELIGEGLCPKKALIISAYLQRDCDIEQMAGEFNIPTSHIRHKPIVEEDFDCLVEDIFGKPNFFHLDIEKTVNNFAKYMSNKLKKMTLKHFVFTIAFVMFLVLFFPTLEIWKLHQFHDKFNVKMAQYSEQEFKNFHENGKVSHNTYIKHREKIGDYTIEIRIYPNDFVHILVSSPLYGAADYWLSDKAFLKIHGIGHEDDFIDIFLITWKKTFKTLMGATP